VAACVRSGETGTMDAWNYKQNGYAGTYQITGTSATVASQNHMGVLESDSYADQVAVQGVHPTYVRFSEDSANQVFYYKTDVPISYQQHMVGEPGTISTTEFGHHYSENTTGDIYSQMVSDLMQETTADKLLAQTNGVYLIQQVIGQGTAQEFLTAQSASPQTVTGDAGGVENILRGNTTADPSTLYGDRHLDLSYTNLTSLATVDDFIAAQSANPQRGTGNAGGMENIFRGNTSADPSSRNGDGHLELSHTNFASQAAVHNFIAEQRANPQPKRGDASGLEKILPRNTTADPSSRNGDRHLELSHTNFASLASVHNFIAEQRANPQPKRGDASGVEKILPRKRTADPSSLNGDGHLESSHTNLTSPATVLWLIQNYEAAEGMSLAFSTVYKHYLHHCKENKLNPVNQSLFGKLFRSVFLGLKTRRFGIRRKTKYCYYGIRVIPGSALNNLSEEVKSAVGQQTSSKKSNKILSGSDNSVSGTQKIENQYAQNIYRSISSDHSYSSAQLPHDHQFQSEAIPDFPGVRFDLPEDFVFKV
jgi:hypothetical protein